MHSVNIMLFCAAVDDGPCLIMNECGINYNSEHV